MTTGEVLSFLKQQGINFSAWNLHKLVERGILPSPIRMYRFAKYSPVLWASDTVRKIKLFLMLDQCKKRHKAY